MRDICHKLMLIINKEEDKNGLILRMEKFDLNILIIFNFYLKMNNDIFF